jgi:leader peptidase (prepilin peptidase)/N-methyltransferase
MLAIVGLVLGSFLNVCISRIPRDESIVSPRSCCPRCGRPIRWCHNIPVVSFVLLKGRCAECRQPISFRYPEVELLTAALFIGCCAKFGFTLELLKFSLFSFLLVGLIFMDAETGLLPREFTYSGIGLGLLFAWIVPGHGSGTEFLLALLGMHINLGVRQLSLLDSVIAIAFGAAFFYSIWAIYYLVRQRHGLGFGDIALIAMCGAFLGLKLTVFVLFAAPIVGSLFAIALLLRNAFDRASPASGGQRRCTADMLRVGEVPFGVFLGGCSLLAIFWGDAGWRYYLRWAGLG